MNVLDEIKGDFERADALVNILIDRATGQLEEDDAYLQLRSYFLENPALSPKLPKWLQSKRSLNQFWHFIKLKFPSYAERREFLWSEFEPLLSEQPMGSVHAF